MAIRLHVEPAGDSIRATLDIPSLLMAWEPLPAIVTGGGVEVELPFGLGPMSIDPTGDEVHARKPLADDTLTLRLDRADPPPFSREDVRFRSGGTSLAGSVLTPPGNGPHPAVVLVHGSGRQGRDTGIYRGWADFFVRRGFVVLYYDKRGVGESGGEYGAGLRLLAEDGLAAVEHLRARPGVDPARVGLKGSSQGAWISKQVASTAGDLSFLVLVSAAADTPRDQEMQQIEYGMRDDGRDEDLIQDALAYMGLYFYVARTGEGWDLLESAVERAQAEEWGQYVDQPETLEDLDWWHENHAFQPAEVVAELAVPVLLLYGGADWITPAIENAEKLRSLFPSPERVEVHTFPRADHRLEVEAWLDEGGAWNWPQIAPGAREAVTEWLRELGSVISSSESGTGEASGGGSGRDR